MRTRRFFALVGLIWGLLAVAFVLDTNLFQAVVAAIASLVSLLLWWYTTYYKHVES